MNDQTIKSRLEATPYWDILKLCRALLPKSNVRELEQIELCERIVGISDRNAAVQFVFHELMRRYEELLDFAYKKSFAVSSIKEAVAKSPFNSTGPDVQPVGEVEEVSAWDAFDLPNAFVQGNSFKLWEYPEEFKNVVGYPSVRIDIHTEKE